VTTLKARQVEKALVAKLGFEEREGHHRIFRLYLDGRLVARTFFSLGQRDLTEFLIGQMARQMRLSRQEYLSAVECPLDRESYYALVRQRTSASD
jgi:hypothetical protein